MPGTKSKKPVDKIPGEIHPEFQDSIASYKKALLARRRFFNILFNNVSMLTKEHEPNLVVFKESLGYLIQDADRTIKSAEKYLETIQHQQGTMGLNDIEKTGKAALLVLDKRFIELMSEEKAIFVLENHEILTKNYVWMFFCQPKKIKDEVHFSKGEPSSSSEVSVDSVSKEDFSLAEILCEVSVDSVSKEDFSLAKILCEVNEELAKLGNPYRPHFSQASAGLLFTATPNVSTSSPLIIGKSVREVGEKIKAKVFSKEVINVGVFFYNDHWVSANNRSLISASISMVEPRLEVIFPDTVFINFYDLKKSALVDKATNSGRFKGGTVDSKEYFSITFDDNSATIMVPEAWGPTTPQRTVDEVRGPSVPGVHGEGLRQHGLFATPLTTTPKQGDQAPRNEPKSPTK